MASIQTRAAKVWLDEGDGVVHLRPHTNRLQDRSDAVENVEAVRLVCGGIRRPLLIHYQSAAPQTPECRAYYMSPEGRRDVIAVAIVTRSTLGRIVGNLMLGLSIGDPPMRLFEDEEAALAWIKRLWPPSECASHRMPSEP